MSRYAVSMMSPSTDDKFVYTLAVNLIGSLLIGVIWGLLQIFNMSREWNLFAITGFLGGFTTFSSFALETVTLATGGQSVRAAVYAALSLFGTIAACAIGLWLVRFIYELSHN